MSIMPAEARHMVKERVGNRTDTRTLEAPCAD